MPSTPLTLPGAELAFDPHWLGAAAAQSLFDELMERIAWETHRIRIYGRWVDSPRLSCWIGDADAVYTYSGTRFVPHDWPAALRPVRERLHRELGTDFNGVLANLYRSGADSMGWHSDSETELGPQPFIASLSLGATRRFALKERRDPARKLKLDLGAGSLLTMAGDTQTNYRHALPRTAKPVGARINLTFRRILAPR